MQPSPCRSPSRTNSRIDLGKSYSHVESGLTRHHLSVSLDLIGSRNSKWHEFMVDIVDYKASGELADGEQPPSEAFGSWIRSKIIPKKIFKWSPYDTAGESELTFDGEEIKRGSRGDDR